SSACVPASMVNSWSSSLVTYRTLPSLGANPTHNVLAVHHEDGIRIVALMPNVAVSITATTSSSITVEYTYAPSGDTASTSPTPPTSVLPSMAPVAALTAVTSTSPKLDT